MNGAPICGAQQPTPIPGSFDWWPFAAAGSIAGGVAYVWTNGIPIINGIVGASGATFGFSTLTGGFVGAAAIFALVLYFALKPDGCIRSTPKGEPICLSGIVEDTVDQSSTAVAILAPFAIGPAGLFDLVVKAIYWHYVTQSSFWVYCNSKGAAMLPCIIKSKTACGAKIGSLIGAAAGAIGGIILGYLAAAALGAAIGCAASGPFYLLCLLVALIVAAIVAAVVAYVGAAIGGWVGQAIASAGSDPVGDDWKGLDPGAIVTVKGNWVTDPDVGNNELFYTTDINRTGQFSSGPSYTTADADSTAPDDCPIAPPPPQ
ncbi:MAG: hypothetical protein DME33_05625 [Verrucomicrobia bacterium]|nr:MAG: hypothetical protein DME33_05625 [Verrucomicrobiota bacterium]